MLEAKGHAVPSADARAERVIHGTIFGTIALQPDPGRQHTSGRFTRPDNQFQKRFERIIDLTREIFPSYEGLIYVAPSGMVVRAIAPLLTHKTVDPAVVVVDVGGRWAVSLLGGLLGWGAGLLASWVALPYFAETRVVFEFKPLLAIVSIAAGAKAMAKSDRA